MTQLNPENKCAHLYDQKINTDLTDFIVDAFRLQSELQKRLSKEGKALDYEHATFSERIQDITTQWRNMNLEMSELLERLPYKEWKNYSDEQKLNWLNREHQLEVWYEYIDVFHFFLNVGLALGISGPVFERLYLTKNKENLDRQDRGY